MELGNAPGCSAGVRLAYNQRRQACDEECMEMGCN
jgi:hypothetical protein